MCMTAALVTAKVMGRKFQLMIARDQASESKWTGQENLDLASRPNGRLASNGILWLCHKTPC